jgi:ABC-type transporter Mla MlaB component
MFRITSRIESGEFVLKVEGCLAGPAVDALHACWHAGVQWPWDSHMRVDLTDVCHVDQAGRTLMSAMYRAGVRFVTKGCVMPEVVREIAQDLDAPRRN